MKNENIIMSGELGMDGVLNKEALAKRNPIERGDQGVGKTMGKDKSINPRNVEEPLIMAEKPELKEQKLRKGVEKAVQIADANSIKNEKAREWLSKSFLVVVPDEKDGEVKKPIQEVLGEIRRTLTGEADDKQANEAFEKNFLIVNKILRGEVEMPGDFQEKFLKAFPDNKGMVQEKINETIYNSLGLGNEEAGKRICDFVDKQFQDAKKAGRPFDINAIEDKGLDELGIVDVMAILSSVIPAPARARSTDSKAGQAPVKVVGEALPAPGARGGTSEPDISTAAPIGREAAEGVSGHPAPVGIKEPFQKPPSDIIGEVLRKLRNYRIGSLALVLIILYLSAMGKWAELVESTGERTAAKRNI